MAFVFKMSSPNTLEAPAEPAIQYPEIKGSSFEWDTSSNVAGLSKINRLSQTSNEGEIGFSEYNGKSYTYLNAKNISLDKQLSNLKFKKAIFFSKSQVYIQLVLPKESSNFPQDIFFIFSGRYENKNGLKFNFDILDEEGNVISSAEVDFATPNPEGKIIFSENR